MFGRDYSPPPRAPRGGVAAPLRKPVGPRAALFHERNPKMSVHILLKSQAWFLGSLGMSRSSEAAQTGWLVTPKCFGNAFLKDGVWATPCARGYAAARAVPLC